MAKKTSKASKDPKLAGLAAASAPSADATTKKPKTDPKVKAQRPAKGKMSALDAAAKVLAENGSEMTTGAMIEAMAAKRYWSSPGGKTPAATLYSALMRECNVKGKESRFTKTGRGTFGLRS
jgi:hypothetical protein